MTSDAMFERLWEGSARMQEWTNSVSHGAITSVARNIITIHTTYFCGNVTAISTNEGLVVVDTANEETCEKVLSLIRSWDKSPIHSIIYTHGHVDHTSGTRAIDNEADEKGLARPVITGHRNVARRMDRYKVTHGLNSLVQGQQFGKPGYTYPIGHRQPDRSYDHTLAIDTGGQAFEIFHGRGETDDASFVWCPKERTLISGDFVIWMFPNGGNPRKMQRYATEWAENLRKMAAFEAEVLIPGHGPVIFGADRVRQVLEHGAELLEQLVADTLALLNNGSTLEEVLHNVKARPDLLSRPYLQPMYDEPEFLVRALYHFYAGWFDGNPAHLKPPRNADLAAEIASLAGGADKLVERALELMARGETRVALELAEYARAAAPLDADIRTQRASIIQKAAEAETSLMAKSFLSAGL